MKETSKYPTNAYEAVKHKASPNMAKWCSYMADVSSSDNQCECSVEI